MFDYVVPMFYYDFYLVFDCEDIVFDSGDSPFDRCRCRICISFDFVLSLRAFVCFDEVITLLIICQTSTFTSVGYILRLKCKVCIVHECQHQKVFSSASPQQHLEQHTEAQCICYVTC